MNDYLISQDECKPTKKHRKIHELLYCHERWNTIR